MSWTSCQEDNECSEGGEHILFGSLHTSAFHIHEWRGIFWFARVARGMSIKVVLLLVAAHVARALPVDPRSLRPPLTYAESFKASATSPVEMTPIGYCESPYKERFGTPRQSVVTAQTAGGSAAQEEP